MKAVIYARVSSEKQAERGTSIPAQIKICTEYIKKQGWTLYKTYIDEAKSALSVDRPAFQEMIEEAKKIPPPFQAIVIYSFSRFARNRLDAITYKLLLRKRGIKIVSVTEPVEENTPEGKLLEGIIEVINEFYSSNLARETFRGLKENASQGFWNGGIPPIGYKTKKIKIGETTKTTLEIDEEYADLVRTIYKKWIEGDGLKKIAIYLNSKGIKPPKKDYWTPSTIRGILKNEIYTGTLIWNKYDKKTKGKKYKPESEWIRIKDVYPVIIDEETFIKAQERFKRRTTPYKEGKVYILSGLLKCGKCGSSYVRIGNTKKRNGHTYTYSYYKCKRRNDLGKETCDNVVLKAEEFEKYILNTVYKRIFSKDSIHKVYKYLKSNENKKELLGELGVLKREYQRINKKIENLYKAIEEGLPKGLLKDRLEKRLKDREKLKKNIKLLEEEIKRTKVTYESVKRLMNSVKERLKEEKDPKKINALLKSMIDYISISGTYIEIFYRFSLSDDKEASPEKKSVSSKLVPRVRLSNYCRHFTLKTRIIPTCIVKST